MKAVDRDDFYFILFYYFVNVSLLCFAVKFVFAVTIKAFSLIENIKNKNTLKAVEKVKLLDEEEEDWEDFNNEKINEWIDSVKNNEKLQLNSAVSNEKEEQVDSKVNDSLENDFEFNVDDELKLVRPPIQPLAFDTESEVSEIETLLFSNTSNEEILQDLVIPEFTTLKLKTRLDSDSGIEEDHVTGLVIESDLNAHALKLKLANRINEPSTPSRIPVPVRLFKQNEQIFGDGTELDELDDLSTETITEKNSPVKRAASIATPSFNRRTLKLFEEKSGHVQKYTNAERISETNSLKNTMLKPVVSNVPKAIGTLTRKFNQPKKEKERFKSKKSGLKKKPTLIQNLNKSVPKSMNGMVFNPKTMQWEGNESELQKFSPKAARPALITHVGSSKVLFEGNMVFDPVQLKWINQEEEEDIFAGMSFSDEEIKPDFLVGEEFDLTPNFIEKLNESERAFEQLAPLTGTLQDIRLLTQQRKKVQLAI